MIRRDLKPANLMIGGSYIESDIQRRILLHELGTVKIADFGALQHHRCQQRLEDCLLTTGLVVVLVLEFHVCCLFFVLSLAPATLPAQ